jgi:hypothetical protein
MPNPTTKPTALNGAIIDSVTQANTKVVNEAPAMAMGNLYQAASQTLGKNLGLAQQANVWPPSATIPNKPTWDSEDQ